MANQRYTGIHPDDRPEAFTTIDSVDARAGDIFQGDKNPNKWYVSQGGGQVDDWRTYYRPVSTLVASPTRASREQEEETKMISLRIDLLVTPEIAEQVRALLEDSVQSITLA